MIDKILEKLETEMNEVVSYDEDDYYLGKYSAYGTAKNIVQEVAKEYGEKKYYRITLSCLEDSTNLELPLTKQEYLLLTRISDLVYRVATGCMPTMYVEQKGE